MTEEVRMGGYAGEILKVYLDREEMVKEPLSRDLAEKYIGGAGLAAYFLYQLVPPQIKADSPKNWVILSTGPLNGTLMPSSARLSVTTLSPVTGIFGDSNSGGEFAPELKYAGYDLILITGRAKRPVYLWINDDEVELRDAIHLVDKTTWEADELIKKELGDWKIKTALVGPTAPKGLLYGCLVVDVAWGQHWPRKICWALP
jgi:aldehyde:ferredoxin oxidoreductase